MRRVGPSRTTAVKIVAFLATVAALHFAQEVLLPVAIAVLLGFALAPIVRWLERWRVPRGAAVALTLALTGLLLGSVVTLVFSQGRDFVQHSAQYRETITERLRSTRLGAAAVQRALSDIKSAAQLPPDSPDADPKVHPPLDPSAAQPPAPLPVATTPPAPASTSPAEPPTSLWSILAQVGALGAVGVITVLLLTAMLLHREDLRDRLVRLLGVDHLPLTRQTLEDASRRISRYLLTQACINTAFGVLIGSGLTLFGMPTPLLFAALSGLLRFIPIVGPLAAMSVSVLTAIAAFPDWHMPLYVLALFACTEALCAYVLEPWLYGRNAGLSLFGIVVAMSFWGWLWGVSGLLVAVPLTVCVVLLGRHFPTLEPLGILLSDAPALSPSDRFHHRLLSKDIAGAMGVIGECEKPPDADKSPCDPVDALWLPSLRRASRDAARGRLVASELADYLATARAVLGAPSPTETATVTLDDRPVLLIASSNQLDALAGEVVRRSLSRLAPSVPIRLFDPGMLTGEIAESADAKNARIMAVISVARAARSRSQLLARALHERVRETPVVLAALTHPNPAENAVRVVGGVRRVQTIAELREALGLVSPSNARPPEPPLSERSVTKPDAYEASPTPPRVTPKPAH